MEDFKTEQIFPLLRSMGLDPQQLGPEKMKLLEKLAKKLADPSNLEKDPETILKELDLGQRQEKTKQKRNAKCVCGSQKKSKKCCNQ